MKNRDPVSPVAVSNVFSSQSNPSRGQGLLKPWGFCSHYPRGTQATYQAPALHTDSSCRACLAGLQHRQRMLTASQGRAALPAGNSPCKRVSNGAAQTRLPTHTALCWLILDILQLSEGAIGNIFIFLQATLKAFFKLGDALIPSFSFSLGKAQRTHFSGELWEFTPSMPQGSPKPRHDTCKGISSHLWSYLSCSTARKGAGSQCILSIRTFLHVHWWNIFRKAQGCPHENTDRSISNTYPQWVQFHSLGLHKHRSSSCPPYRSLQLPHPSQTPWEKKKITVRTLGLEKPLTPKATPKGTLPKQITGSSGLISHVQKSEVNVPASSYGILHALPAKDYSNWRKYFPSCSLWLMHSWVQILYTGTWQRAIAILYFSSAVANPAALADKTVKFHVVLWLFSSLARKHQLSCLKLFKQALREQNLPFRVHWEAFLQPLHRILLLSPCSDAVAIATGFENCFESSVQFSKDRSLWGGQGLGGETKQRNSPAWLILSSSCSLVAELFYFS